MTPQTHVRLKIPASVDGGPSRGSCVHRSGSDGPHSASGITLVCWSYALCSNYNTQTVVYLPKLFCCSHLLYSNKLEAKIHPSPFTTGLELMMCLAIIQLSLGLPLGFLFEGGMGWTPPFSLQPPPPSVTKSPPP